MYVDTFCGVLNTNACYSNSVYLRKRLFIKKDLI